MKNSVHLAKGWYGLLAVLFFPFFLQAQTASVGDFVFRDANANGIQDVGESGISGVFVMLTTCGGDYVTHTTTDAAGAYLFTNVAAGSYKIKFALLPGYLGYSPMHQGDDDALDSDVVPGWTAFTECFDVTGQNDLTIDAGFVPDASTATEVTIACGADMNISATTTKNMTRAYFGDKQNNAVVVVNVEDFEKAGFVPTGHLVTYTADKVANTGKLYAVNRGSDAIDVIDGISLELTHTIPMAHYPRSAESVNTTLGLVAVTGMNKPMVSIIDMQTDEVVATVGSSEITYPVSHNHTGSHACGHPFWLDAHHFILPDRGNLMLYCYSIYQVNGNWETTLLSTTITPSPVHQIIPRKGHYFGPNNLFYASAEGMSKEGPNNVSPSLLELKFTPGQGLTINRALALTKSGVAVAEMGGHHGDFHPFEKKIYIGSREGTLFVVDYENMMIHSTIQAGNGIGHVKMIPSKNLAIAINHKDVFVTVIDLLTNTKIADVIVSPSTDLVGQTTLQAHPKYFVKGDKFYSFTSYDGNFYELDLNTLAVSRVLHLGGKPSQGAFVPVTLDAAPVTWAEPTASSTCSGDVTLTQISGPANGSMVPQGNHIITYVATDQCGNTDTCQFNLVVSPQQPAGPADIGNIVFSDNNGNGLQDAGELGVPDVFVMLMNCAGDYITHTTTDADGHYLFAQIAPGTYKVKFALKTGYQYSPTDAGNDDALDSDVLPGWSGHTACFDLSGTDRMDIDAGFVPDVPPSGEITMNCTPDKTVVLPQGQSSILVNWSEPTATTTCQSGGLVLAQTAGPLNGSSLTEGVYSIAYEATDACGNLESCSFMVAVNGSQLASVSNQVWEDLNGNGIQEAGELGISGVFVMLTDCDENWLDNVFTDANGHYQFDDLVPGYYKIKFALLPNYIFAPTNAGNAEELDSDVLPGWRGFTACFNLASGENRTDIDAGFISDGTNGYVQSSDKFIELSLQQNRFTATLSWQNNTGDINTFFLVERAMDGGRFVPLAQVKQESNTQKNVSFDFQDFEPLAGKNTYRVRAITQTGDNLFSNVVAATFESRNDVTIYPNPTSDYVMVDLLPFKGLGVSISITNNLGQVVKAVYFPKADAAPKRIDLGLLKAGVYHVLIENGQGHIVDKSLIISK